ncbi:MAG: hypothetical protein AAFY67_03855, partial [Cyanobacteria bacterium J06642_9]
TPRSAELTSKPLPRSAERSRRSHSPTPPLPEHSLAAARSRTATLRQPHPSTLKSLPRSIHGIACQLEDHALVLVGEQNLVWLGLTPEQQDQLRQQISWVLADYFYRKRQTDRRLRSRLGILAPPKVSNRALPPINGLRRLMGWIQLGPVAIAANLFKEAELFETLQLRLSHALDAQAQAAQLASTAQITSAVPAKEASQLRPVVLPVLIDYRARLTAIATHWLYTSELANRLAQIKLPPVLHQIRAKMLPPSPPHPPSDHLPATVVFPPLGSAQTPTTQLVTLSAIATPISPSGPTQAPRQASTTAVIPKPKRQQAVTLEIDQPLDNPTPTPLPNSHCLETKATLVEYIEHPLEKLLRWIDQLLSQLEAWIEGLFTWLKALFRERK